jgi:hypothetical protein
MYQFGFRMPPILAGVPVGLPRAYTAAEAISRLGKSLHAIPEIDHIQDSSDLLTPPWPGVWQK